MSAPALVILAAGAGTRLGTCKALADLGGTTPLAELCAAGARLAPPAPLVVGGAHADAILAALPERADFARNELWQTGRLSSVRCAVRARPGLDLCLAPVDVPLVPAEVFEALARAWESAGAPERGWLAPWVLARGRRAHGHPVVLGCSLLAELLLGPAELPLKAFRMRAEPLLEVEVRSLAVLDDLDSPADLALLRARRGF
jgi:molybdenum cofactor cytidylyltransferase